MKTVLLFLLPVFVIWTTSLFREVGLRIRWDERDHWFFAGYGEIYGYWHAIPEEWFDYEFTLTSYPVGKSPDFLTSLTGETLYPGVAINHPEVMDGFQIPMWNICVLVILLYLTLRHMKRSKQGEAV